MAEELVTDPLFETIEEAILIDIPEITKEVEEKLIDNDITTADENITNTNKLEDKPVSTDSNDMLESLPQEVAMEELLAGHAKNELEEETANIENECNTVEVKDAVECEDVVKVDTPICNIRNDIGNTLRRRPVPFTRTARYRFARSLKRRSIKL